MKAFVTGGTGFVGGHLVKKLRERGDEVVALVRSPSKADALVELRCQMVEGDLGDQALIQAGMSGCEAVFHSAALYKVGIAASERPAMFEANVRGTERVLDAAVEAGVARIVYVSTIGVFGNTRGVVVDETYVRSPESPYLSTYDETKFLAHKAAQERIARGAPVLIAQPGGVYGPGDTSEIANFIDQMRRGKLKFMTFPDLGFNFLHVDDCVDGILAIHDRGRIGESYVLGGEITTMRRALKAAGAALGRKAPRFSIPGPLIKLSIPFAPLVTRAMGLPPNLRELIRSADGVTYWATDAKARRELGYAPRGLETGLRQTLA